MKIIPKSLILTMMFSLLFPGYVSAQGIFGGDLLDRWSIFQGQPHIQFAEPEYNFGAIYQGEQVTHRFKFKNTGRGKLHIERVETGCGCTMASLSADRIAPQKTGELAVVYESARQKGPVAKSIYVYTNDARQPKVKLKLYGEVKVETEAVPPYIFFQRLIGSDPISKEVEITSELPDIEIIAVKSSSELICAEVVEDEIIESALDEMSAEQLVSEDAIIESVPAEVSEEEFVDEEAAPETVVLGDRVTDETLPDKNVTEGIDTDNIAAGEIVIEDMPTTEIVSIEIVTEEMPTIELVSSEIVSKRKPRIRITVDPTEITANLSEKVTVYTSGYIQPEITIHVVVINQRERSEGSPPSIELLLTKGFVAKTDFQKPELTLNLIEEGIIEKYKSNSDYVYFDEGIEDEDQLRERLEEIKLVDPESVLAVWQRSHQDKIAVDQVIFILLEDQDAERRGEAARLLGKIGDKSAVDPLVMAALKDRHPWVREDAVAALGAIGDDKAIGPLQQAAEDRDEDVRAAAKDVLEKFTNQ